MPIHRLLTSFEQHRANKILSQEPKCWSKDDKAFIENIDPTRIELSPATKEAIISIYQTPINYFTKTKAIKLLERDRNKWTIEDLIFINSIDLSKIRLPKSITDSGINADFISQSQT